ncbi:MAG TPA: PIG-L family deacetylase [Burkholderiaceae bacterium]|nr:PIG-L family deacetylase [Burkholderiaceae bacterium]
MNSSFETPDWQAGSGILVLSPHFDDAVLSCGAFLAQHPGATVLTAYAGQPGYDVPAPQWDRRCGFVNARQAMLTRSQENWRALEILQARNEQLHMLDSQYGGTGEGLFEHLQQTLQDRRPDTVLLPLGLFHEDHIQLADAALDLRKQGPDDQEWIAYEDVPYCRHPGQVQRRLAWLSEQGVCATRWLTVWADTDKKRHAVSAYSSQLEALGLTPGSGDDALPEHYWRLTDMEPDNG